MIHGFASPPGTHRDCTEVSVYDGTVGAVFDANEITLKGRVP